MKAIVPYLIFKGDCKEAMDFYAKCLNGEVENVSTFSEMEMEVADEFKDKIMHGKVKAGDLTLFCSDTIEKTEATIKGNSINLSVNISDKEEMEKIFASLAEGGYIINPLHDAPWGGAYFGKLADKFGFLWMLNYDYPKNDSNK